MQCWWIRGGAVFVAACRICFGWVSCCRDAYLAAANFAERRYRFALAAVIAVILVIALTQWNNWRTGWTVNMGVLAMARQQFADWPTGEWDDGSTAARLGSAEQRFEQALTSDPDNATAHHRLGLIAMLRRDYAAAAAHLQAAYDQNPGHDGIRKNLGLSYALAW